MTRPRSKASASQATPSAAAATVAAVGERARTVIDTLPARVPVTTGEVEAVLTYLWPCIEALLREGKQR